jgi:hypothetical protein
LPKWSTGESRPSRSNSAASSTVNPISVRGDIPVKVTPTIAAVEGEKPKKAADGMPLEKFELIAISNIDRIRSNRFNQKTTEKLNVTSAVPPLNVAQTASGLCRTRVARARLSAAD